MTNTSDRVEFSLSQVPNFADPAKRRPGVRRQNPFRILTLALDRALGNFAAVICYAASVKAQFDHARLAVYFRNDRHYKSDILSICPDIDEIFEMNDDESHPLDAMDIGFDAPIPPPKHWHAKGWNSPHLLITPSMAAFQNLGSFEQTARFRFNNEDAALQEKSLLDAGVDPNRWFCVIHHREPTYGHRSAQPLRDVDPKSFETLAHWIIETLGGQVVRIGHPEMRPFEAKPGFVDLAPLGGRNFKLQLYAIWRARFMLASNSGPGICGGTLGTPTAMCNNPAIHTVWNRQDAAMWSHIIAPDGRRISREVALKREMYFVSGLNHLKSLGYEIVHQSSEELKRLVSLMHERTADTTKWREHWYTRTNPIRPNTLPIGVDPIDQQTCVEFPDLAPGKGTIRLGRPSS